MTRNKKWFDGHKQKAPQQVYEQQHVPCERARLIRLIETLRSEQKRLCPDTVNTLMRLVILPPAVRLKVNLTVTLGLIVGGRIGSILADGLRLEERAALVDLQLRRIPIEALETAHGLLDIEKRIRLVEALGDIFEVERSRKTGHLYAEEAQEILEGKKLYGGKNG